MKTIAFFNNKGGVGKTTLLFHVAHMFAKQGRGVVVVDLDPQANLTAMFLDERRLEDLWRDGGRATVYSAMRPLMEGTGDLLDVQPEHINDRLGLLAGDLGLANTEDELSTQWGRCLAGEPRAFRLSAAFDRMLRGAGAALEAEYGLVDVGPNLGAINRCALVAADYVVIPIGADLFSLRGLQNVGPKLQQWRRDWQDRRSRAPANLGFELPSGSMSPIGYIVSRFTRYKNEPARAYQAWLDRAPAVYAQEVQQATPPIPMTPDANRIAELKDYRSLTPMAQESHKPMFDLKPADGAIGAHMTAVGNCDADFRRLAVEIARRCETGSA